MTPQNKTTYIAIAAALLSCIIWSGNFVLARGVNDLLQPASFSFWRWIVAFVVLLPFTLPHLKKDIKLVKGRWGYFIAMGVVGVAIFGMLIYLSAHYTSTSNISLIVTISPVLSLFLAGLLKQESLTKYKIIGTICALLGAITVILKGDLATIIAMDFNKGDLIVLAAAFCWTFYCVLAKYKPEEMHTSVFLLLIIAIGIVTILPFYLWEVSVYGMNEFSVRTWGAFLYTGIASSVISWFTWVYAIQKIGTIRTTMIYYTMPVFSGIMAMIFLDEKVHLYHGVGFILIFLGMIFANFKLRKR